MASYLIRKVLSVIPNVFGVMVIVFLLFNAVGGDPAYQMLGRHASAAQITELRTRYGWDQPLSAQFVRYCKQVLTFDLGESYATRRPIRDMIVEGIAPSLSLAIPAFAITTIVSILLGLLVAYYRGRMIDRLVVVGSVFGMSLSILAYILFGQYFLAYKLGWFPISGYETDWSRRFEFLGLPILIWFAVSLGNGVRYYRTAILEETHQDYVRTARAKGLGEARVYLRHVLKNSLIPIITNVVIEIPLLVLGSFLLENFFSIPGLGSITIDALHNSDLPVVQAMTLMISFLVITGNLLTDVLYTWADPRVRLQ